MMREDDELEYNAILNNNLIDEILNTIAEIRNNATNLFETLPDMEFFESLQLSCEPDIFFEGMILSLKNEVLAKQARTFKLKRIRKDKIRSELAKLKVNYKENANQIYALELLLDTIIEQELKEELIKYEKFHRLNDEKARL
jgi:hypothetical protein